MTPPRDSPAYFAAREILRLRAYEHVTTDTEETDALAEIIQRCAVDEMDQRIKMAEATRDGWEQRYRVVIARLSRIVGKALVRLS